MTQLRWRKRNGTILPPVGSVRPGKEVVLGSDDFVARPDYFTIYRKPTALVARVREEKSKSPLIKVDSLPVNRPGDGPSSSRTEPWQLPVPSFPRLKWRLLFADDKLHSSPFLHVSKLADVNLSLAPKAKVGTIPGGPSVDVGVIDIKATVITSVDPAIHLSVMTPWAQDTDANLWEFLHELAADSTEEGEDPAQLEEELITYLRPHLPEQAPGGWEFILPTSHLRLGDGERAEVSVQLRAPTRGSTAFALQVAEEGRGEPNAVVSDVVIIEVPEDPTKVSLLFASDDATLELSLQGDLSELVSWGTTAARRFLTRFR